MPRLARIVAPGVAHHVTQRGNNRQDVFFLDDDRRVYLSLLKQQADRYGLKLLGYCLMTNHVHLVVLPKAEDSLAKAVGRTHWRYTRYVDEFHGRSGHLWQNRFHSCALDEGHCWAALSYVERNPVRAKMVRSPWEYPWSSARAHCGIGDSSLSLDSRAWGRCWTPETWKRWLARPEDQEKLSVLRTGACRGWPLGSDSFISKLEAALGRRVRPLPVGRPRRHSEEGRKR